MDAKQNPIISVNFLMELLNSGYYMSVKFLIKKNEQSCELILVLHGINMYVDSSCQFRIIRETMTVRKYRLLDSRIDQYRMDLVS